MERRTELVVIGSGPGGYVAAIRAAQLGKKVTIVEKGDLGGVCLNRGCIPSKAIISAAKTYEQFKMSKQNNIGIIAKDVSLDFAQVQQWKQEIVRQLQRGVKRLLARNQIEIIKGTATFANRDTLQITSDQEEVFLRFEKCIIATGAKPREIPTFPFGERILSSTDLLQLDQIPESLVVIGGGYIGIELSQAFAKFGTKITLLEGANRILPSFDTTLSKLVHNELKKQGTDIITSAEVTAVTKKGEKVAVTYRKDGREETVEGEYLFIAIGRKPNVDSLRLESAGIERTDEGFIAVNKSCQTTNENVYAIGDVTLGPQLAHKASYEGKVAAEVIAGLPSVVDYRAIPAVIFSDPEIAIVGITEEEAKRNNRNVRVGTFSYSANGRALTMNERSGFVQIISDEETGDILGGYVVGPEASNLIAELTLAIEMGSSIYDIGLTIHPHPTLSEIIMEAAEDAQGRCIHSLHSL